MAEKKEHEMPPEWKRDAFNRALAVFRGDDRHQEGLEYLSWHATAQMKFQLHPCVDDMLRWQPLDPIKLAHEWPHIAASDPTRLAYTRNDTDGEADRQLITSIGKYLVRHWPGVPDHVRRDVQAGFTPDEMYFVHTTPEIIQSIEVGPRSCMASVYGSIPFSRGDNEQMKLWFLDKENEEPDWLLHPYWCYAPEYGWHMALRKGKNGTIDGRALCIKHNDKNIFVRTYRRHQTDPNGWSETDFNLQEWLKKQGYVLHDEWPSGAKLRTHDDDARGWFLPYMDGSQRGVNVRSNVATITHERGAELWCENTHGFVNEPREGEGGEDMTSCDCCEDSYETDDMYSVGRPGESQTLVCYDCRRNSFSFARGDWNNRSGYLEYYTHEDDWAYVEGRDYNVDTTHMPSFIICDVDGNYRHQEDVILVDEEYYATEDLRIVFLKDEQEYGLRKHAFKAENGSWWSSQAAYEEENIPPEDEDEDEEAEVEVEFQHIPQGHSHDLVQQI